jgi:Raf kinase inhibitor-like YbhB/YbcL family protein
MTLQLTSPAFEQGGNIPQKHTCDGADLTPALNWNASPPGTRSYCLIMDDPDAPGRTWVHWVLYNLPAGLRALPEGLPKEKELADGTRQGRNDFARVGYGGPCPPRGPAHRYFFKLYALDVRLDQPPGASKADIEKAMDKHVLAQGQLMGQYQR